MKVSALLLALGLLLSGAHVRAASPASDEARRYFDAGNQAYAGAQYVLAARAYEEAYQRDPLPEIAFSIAQAYRLAYHAERDPRWIEAALRRYREYLDRVPSGRRRAHAVAHVAVLERALTENRGPNTETTGEAVSPRAPGAELTQLMVVSRTPRARAAIAGGVRRSVPFRERVTPGKHRVRVEAPGFAPAEAEWLAVEGRLVVAELELVPLPARVEIAGEASGTLSIDGRRIASLPVHHPIELTPGTHVLVVTERGRTPFRRKLELDGGSRARVLVASETTLQRKVSYGLLAGAGAAAITGGVLLLLALDAEGDARALDRERQSSALTPAEHDDLGRALERRNGFRTVSIASFTAAAALAITGGLLFHFDLPSVDADTGTLRATLPPRTARSRRALGF